MLNSAFNWTYRESALLLAAVQAQRERWPLWLPVLLGAGIGGYFSLPVEPPLWLGGAVLLAGLPAFWLLRRSGGSLIALAALLAVILGFTVAQWRTASVATPVISGKMKFAAVSGQVLAVERRARGNRLWLRELLIEEVKAADTPHSIRLRVGHLPPGLQPGDWVSLRANILAPPGPSSPGGFDYSRLAWFQRIGGVGFAVSKVTALPPPAGEGGISAMIRLNQYRFALSQEIRRLLPGESGALAAALLTGDRGGISKETMAAMRDSGLAHLLAISGLHVGLLTMTLFFALRYLFACVPFVALRYPIKKWAALFSLAGAFCYFLLAGMTVPTQRAFIMIALSLGAVMLDRRAISLRLVAVAAAIILLWRPESLVSVSFQMSFAAVVVLVAVYEVAGPMFSNWRRHAGIVRRAGLYVAAVSLTTLAASIATAPFALYHFHKVASFGLVANLLAVPIMAFWVMPVGLLALVLVPLGLGLVPLLLMGVGIDVVAYIAVTVAGWEGATHGLPALPTLTLVGVTLSGLWLCLWRGPIRLAAAGGFALALLPALLWRPPDALVSADGAAFAVASPNGVHVPDGVRVNRVMRDWLARWGDEKLLRGRSGSDPTLACDNLACLHRGGEGVLVSYVFDKGALQEDCRSANVVIATMPVGRRCAAPDGVIDRYDLWRKGAHALWFEHDRVLIKTVADERGVRPWSDGRRY